MGAHLFRRRAGVQLVIDQNLHVVFFLVAQAFDLQHIQLQRIVRSTSVFVQHERFLQAGNPLVTFFAGLTTEISSGSRTCVRDLEPSVLTDDGGMHRLNSDVLGVQLETLDQALKEFYFGLHCTTTSEQKSALSTFFFSIRLEALPV